MINKLGEYIKDFRTVKHNYSLRQFAQMCDISHTHIDSIERGIDPRTGKVVKVTNDTIEKLAKAMNVSSSFLFDLSLNKNSTNDQQYKDEKPKKKAYKIPVYGEIAAGIPINMIQDIIDYEEVDEHTYNRGELLALKIKGDSMEPRICDGDVVIIRKQPDVDSGEIAAVIIDGDSATLKKVKKDKKGIYLIPFNNDYDTVFYTNNEMEQLPVIILGKLIELRGKF